MILVITHKTDFTADYVINILNEREIPYRRLNCEDILQSDLIITFQPSLGYTLLGQEGYSSVWFRRTMLPIVDLNSKSEQAYILGEIEDLMSNLFTVIDAKWINTPQNVYHAENKLYQLSIASKIGFKIPSTLVTTNKICLTNFYHENNSIIIKPISRTRIQNESHAEFIFTNRVTNTHINGLQSYDLTPCIFQEEIEKEVELRVTIVRDKVFAAQVDSQSDPESNIDWRRKKLTFTLFKLPSEIECKCIEIVKKLGLVFGAIDLILSPDGTYTFLEINPNGQWVWIEIETGHKISEAIINELIIP